MTERVTGRPSTDTEHQLDEQLMTAVKPTNHHLKAGTEVPPQSQADYPRITELDQLSGQLPPRRTGQRPTTCAPLEARGREPDGHRRRLQPDHPHHPRPYLDQIMWNIVVRSRRRSTRLITPTLGIVADSRPSPLRVGRLTIGVASFVGRPHPRLQPPPGFWRVGPSVEGWTWRPAGRAVTAAPL